MGILRGREKWRTVSRRHQEVEAIQSFLRTMFADLKLLGQGPSKRFQVSGSSHPRVLSRCFKANKFKLTHYQRAKCVVDRRELRKFGALLRRSIDLNFVQFHFKVHKCAQLFYRRLVEIWLAVFRTA